MARHNQSPHQPAMTVGKRKPGSTGDLDSLPPPPPPHPPHRLRAQRCVSAFAEFKLHKKERGGGGGGGNNKIPSHLLQNMSRKWNAEGLLI